MKLTLKRMTTVLLALFMMLIFVPAMTAYADDNVDSAKITILAVPEVNTLNPVLQDITVPADAATKAGYQVNAEYASKVTIADAIVVLHQKYFGPAFDQNPTNYLTMSNGTIKTFFGKEVDYGKEIANMMFYVNNKYPEYADQPGTGSLADDTVLKDGDIVRIFGMFSDYYADNFLVFDWTEKTAAIGQDVTLNVKSFWAISLGKQEPANLEGVVLDIRDEEGNVATTATTDSEGNATFSLNQPGEYTVTVKSIPEDEDYEEAIFVSDYAELTVEDIAPEATASVKAAVRGFEKANKFDILPQEITVSSTTAEKYGDYGDIAAGNNGKVTVADLMYTLHEKKFEGVTVDNISDYFIMASDGWILKYFKVDNSSQIYYTNNDLAMAGTPYQRVLSDGDAFDQFMYQDATGWSDVAAAFAETEKTVAVGEEFELDLLRVNWDGTTAPLPKSAKGTVTAALVDENGELTPIDGAEMDENGKIKLSFDKQGTYLVSASGKAAGEWGDGAISAPYCTVTATEAEVTPAPITPPPTVVKGKTYKKGGQSFKVTKAAKGKTAGTVTFTKAKNAKNVTVPATVKLADNKTYKVTVVGAKAFTGKKIRTVTIGKNVTKIKAKAFAKSKATKMIIKTKKLKNKASVKGSLKGSKIKTVKVKVGKKFVKKYKKFFTKKNAGKKVKVS